MYISVILLYHYYTDVIGFVQRLVVHWSTGEETVRVLAFLCINRLTIANQQSTLEYCLKVSSSNY